MNRRQSRARQEAMSRMAQNLRHRPSKALAIGVFALLTALVVLGPTVLLAAASPSGQPTPSVTPFLPSSTPMMDMSTPTPLPSQEEFFNSDERTNVADYDNPAYTYDQEDDPGVIESYLDELMLENSDTVDILIMLTLMALVPSMLIMLTGFTRILIVLSFTRNALGTQNMPPNQVIIGLALFLTFFLMFPTLEVIRDTALEPYLAEEITITQAGERAIEPLREFMLAQTWEDDLELFCEIGGIDPASFDLDERGAPQIPLHVLMPAFLTSEIKTAFWLGFCIYIPFIVIDMIVASTLMSMGMMMLPPVMISLPFKILLFVSVDGWSQVIKVLLTGFRSWSG